MTVPPARAMLFSVAAAIAYTLAEYFNWPLFHYYLSGGFHILEAPGAGRTIHWYGWIATAVAAGALVALAAPRRILARFPADLTWMVLIATMLAVLVYEKRWFY